MKRCLNKILIILMMVIIIFTSINVKKNEVKADTETVQIDINDIVKYYAPINDFSYGNFDAANIVLNQYPEIRNYLNNFMFKLKDGAEGLVDPIVGATLGYIKGDDIQESAGRYIHVEAYERLFENVALEAIDDDAQIDFIGKADTAQTFIDALEFYGDTAKISNDVLESTLDFYALEEESKDIALMVFGETYEQFNKGFQQRGELLDDSGEVLGYASLAVTLACGVLNDSMAPLMAIDGLEKILLESYNGTSSESVIKQAAQSIRHKFSTNYTEYVASVLVDVAWDKLKGYAVDEAFKELGYGGVFSVADSIIKVTALVLGFENKVNDYMDVVFLDLAFECVKSYESIYRNNITIDLYTGQSIINYRDAYFALKYLALAYNKAALKITKHSFKDNQEQKMIDSILENGYQTIKNQHKSPTSLEYYLMNEGTVFEIYFNMNGETPRYSVMGKDIELSGKIESENIINNLTIKIIDYSGETLINQQLNKEGQILNFEDFNELIDFSILNSGDKYIEIYAENEYGNYLVYSRGFVVINLSDISADNSIEDIGVVTNAQSLYGNTPANIANGGYAVAYKGWIYYLDEEMRSIRKMKSDGTNDTVFLDDIDIGSYNLNVYNDTFYYTCGSCVYSTSLDGYNKSKIFESDGRIRRAYVYDNYMYLLLRHYDESWSIKKINLGNYEETDVKALVDGVKSVELTILDGTIHYVAEFDDYSDGPDHTFHYGYIDIDSNEEEIVEGFSDAWIEKLITYNGGLYQVWGSGGGYGVNGIYSNEHNTNKITFDYDAIDVWGIYTLNFKESLMYISADLFPNDNYDNLYSCILEYDNDTDTFKQILNVKDNIGYIVIADNWLFYHEYLYVNGDDNNSLLKINLDEKH